jgi:uncharacterized membrane protein YfcA
MAFSTETAVLLAGIGVAVGASGTLIGAGGGFILTPILLLLYPHDSAQTLTAIILAAVFFLGIGGGVIHVPLLVRALGFPTHPATATSHFVLAIMAGTGTVTHIVLGSFSRGHGVRRAAVLSVGVVVGAQVGAHVSLRLRGAVIQ